jgi:hypothetical protein
VSGDRAAGAWIACIFLFAVGFTCVAAVLRGTDAEVAERRTRDAVVFTTLCRSRCDSIGLEVFEVDPINWTCMCRQVQR